MKKTTQNIITVCDICEEAGRLVKYRTSKKTRDLHPKCINQLIEAAIENKTQKKKPDKKKAFVTKDGKRQRNSTLRCNHNEYPPDLPHSKVKEYLAYDGKKDVLTWRKSPGPSTPEGTVASNDDGSIQFSPYIIRRDQLIYFLINGEWPGEPEEIYWNTKYKDDELKSFKNSPAGQIEGRL